MERKLNCLFCIQDEQKAGESLREKLQIIVPQLEEMRKRKAEREKQFAEVLDELKNISIEIFGSATEINMCGKLVDSDNLSMRRLEQLRNQLCELQNEKVCLPVTCRSQNYQNLEIDTANV